MPIFAFSDHILSFSNVYDPPTNNETITHMHNNIGGGPTKYWPMGIYQDDEKYATVQCNGVVVDVDGDV